MKTTNNVQKAENNMKQSFLRSAAVVASIIMLSFTVSAQDFWKELLTNTPLARVAVLMVQQELDQSMANEAMFEALEEELIAEVVSSGMKKQETMVFAEVDEEPLVIENWMTNESFFRAHNAKYEAKDGVLFIESWMTDNFYFTEEYHPAADKKLAVEAWMLNNPYFHEPVSPAADRVMKLESWMTGCMYWN